MMRLFATTMNRKAMAPGIGESYEFEGITESFAAFIGHLKQKMSC